MCDKQHVFESAGLGQAPYTFLGVQTSMDRAAENAYRASNGMTYTTNNCTTCDYCGTAIQNAYMLRSVDGKVFKVGCDCIEKSGDKGLKKIAKQEQADKARAARRAKAVEARARRVALEQTCLDAWKAGKCEALKSQPHPKGRENATAWDYVDWCVTNKMIGRVAYDLIDSCL